ncbi:hypothetical protein DIE11_22610 [Burkholderia sp. Bp9012]|nr:hypothetical protein DIE11_22610 [Burkholderia sp. Bp9012]
MARMTVSRALRELTAERVLTLTLSAHTITLAALIPGREWRIMFRGRPLAGRGFYALHNMRVRESSRCEVLPGMSGRAVPHMSAMRA